MKSLKILANDGLATSAIKALEELGFDVLTVKVAQEQLVFFLNREKIEVLVVRSATQVDRSVLEAAEHLKLVIRAGVGMDNIDRVAAKEQNVVVQNTPGASSNAVAELVVAHMLGGSRMLHQSNRDMPLEGDQHFKDLKKRFAKGRELKGKTLGVIGFGRIGQELARKAYGLGMRVVFYDRTAQDLDLELEFADGNTIQFKAQYMELADLLKASDFISLHTPKQSNALIGATELDQMKKGAVLINTARGGLIDEKALVAKLEKGELSFAALDVFTQEPQPAVGLLMNPNLSLSPHIGGSTIEAQNRIGEEIVEQIKTFANNGVPLNS
jgi:D-3-phosphoglycerate dehydrogenase